MRLSWTCTGQLLVLLLSVLRFSAAAANLANNKTLAKLTGQLQSASFTHTELLIGATAEILLQHYTTLTSKQLYVRWEDGASGPLVDEILRRTATHLSVLVERDPPVTPADGLDQSHHPQLRLLNLLLVTDRAEFDHVVAGLTDELYDYSGLYTVLLVGASSKRQHLETAGVILRTLWALYIVNVVVLIGDGRQQQADGDDDDDDSDRNHTVPANLPALLDAGYQPYMYRNYSFVFDAYPHIGRRVQLVTAHQFRTAIVRRLQRPGARLCVLLPLETVTFLNRNLTRTGQLLRIARERVTVAKLAIYTQRTSALLGPLNKLLERFVASGLLHRWAAQYHQLRFLANPYQYRGRQQLVLADMDGPFEILLVGLGLGAGTFLIELVVGRWEGGNAKNAKAASNSRTKNRTAVCLSSCVTRSIMTNDASTGNQRAGEHYYYTVDEH
uniref:Putative ionotropic receptor ligand binding domain-containing protein n=1 Tax=Anopheles coluzzii TaxID=1518534 RepID=A0A8W7PRH2_ANOCL